MKTFGNSLALYERTTCLDNKLARDKLLSYQHFDSEKISAKNITNNSYLIIICLVDEYGP